MPVDYTEPRVHNDSPDHWGPILAAVARDVLGDPSTATRHQWRYGTHGSLVVHISGPRAGTWYSFEEDTGGGVLAFLAHFAHLDRADAISFLDSRGLITGTVPPPTTPPPVTRPTPAPRPTTDTAFVTRLWQQSSPVPTDATHPVRRWLAHRVLWHPDLPLPSPVRWLPAQEQVFRNLHQGAGSILVGMATPDQWHASWPLAPNPTAVHLVSIDHAGQPALDRPADHTTHDGRISPGRPKRIHGPANGNVAILGHPHLRRSAGPVRIVEGLADGLAIAARFTGPAILSIGTPARLAHDQHFITWLSDAPHGVIIHSDADEPGQKAARRLRSSLTHAGCSPVRAILPPNGSGKDPADVARTQCPFPPLSDHWTNHARTLADMYPDWPRWEIARQATIAMEFST